MVVLWEGERRRCRDRGMQKKKGNASAGDDEGGKSVWTFKF